MNYTETSQIFAHLMIYGGTVQSFELQHENI